MSIMQEQKMIDESLLLRYFEKEVNEEEKKVEEWIHSSEANSRMAKQVARIFGIATRLLHGSKEASPSRRYRISGDKWNGGNTNAFGDI